MKGDQMYLRGQKKMQKLSRYIKLVDTALTEIAQKNSGLDEAVKKALMSSGKRVRPVVSLLMCEVFCGDYTPALPVAVVFELAHTASLVQDDIIDRSDTRRGQPSVYAQFGVEKAILTSDLLIFEIFNQLAEYERWNLTPKRVYMLLKMLGDSSKATTVGEDMQLDMSKRSETSEEDYFEMIRRKTGALLAAPAASGAIVGGASEEGIDIAYRFGMKLGVAYQLQDDLLDILGKPGEMGKPVFKDLESRNSNIVIIHTLRNAADSDGRYILGLEGKENLSGEDVRKTRHILLKTGSVDYVTKLAADKYEESREALRRLKPCSARHKLMEITYMLSNRAQTESLLLFRRKTKL
ncbi:MAG: polyprenyl synthetase family protein [Nitrososphaerales archaeon]